MTMHTTGTRDEWLAARRELLAAEKALTRMSDELAARRAALPWVALDKAYLFDTENGPATLRDLFQGRSQLLVYHFMFGPDYTAGCPSCSMIADGFDGFAVHLANHDVTLTAISSGPLDRLLAYRRRMGWSFPWASSAPGDFNADFGVAFTSDQQQSDGGVEYNYRREPALVPRPEPSIEAAPLDHPRSCGVDRPTYLRERPGMSAFVLEGEVVHHTYSTFSRGLDGLWGALQWLDRAPLGRNETGAWWRRRDEYRSPAKIHACCG